MSDEELGFEEILLREIGRVLEPVCSAAAAAEGGDQQAIDGLLTDMGLDETALGQKYDTVIAELERLADPWTTIETELLQPIANDQLPDPTQIPDLYKAFRNSFEVFEDIDDIDPPEPEVGRVGELIVDYLLIVYLDRNHPGAYGFLRLIGVIRDGGPGAAGDIDLSALSEALSSPQDLAVDVFAWGTDQFEPYIVLFYVKTVVRQLGLDSTLADLEDDAKDVRQTVQGLDSSDDWPSPEDGSAGGGSSTSPVDRPDVSTRDHELRIDVLSIAGNAGQAEGGVAVIPVPGANGKLPGLAIRAWGALDGSISEELGDDWTFNADLSAGGIWALRVRPEAGGGTITEFFDDASIHSQSAGGGDVHAELALSYDPSSERGLTPILGDPSENGVGIRYFEAGATIDYDGEQLVFIVEVPVRGRLQVTPGGAFLSEILPDGIGYDFDTTVGWQAGEGFYLERGGSLDATIAVEEQLGPFLLQELHGAVGDVADAAGSQPGSQGQDGGSRAEPTSSGGTGRSSGGDDGQGVSGEVSYEEGTITVLATSSGTVELGPVTATVRRVGVEGNLSFPDEGGNLGAADLQMGFKPPSGVGISVDAGAVSGGGFLEFDPDNDRYAGVLTLTLGEMGLKINAVGLLSTDLPGDREGFSLLVIISGEFTPVQLGFGFTLNGVGGIVGLHRSVKAPALQRTVREGSLDSVLFPQNPVANAPRIISDLRTIFPVTPDTHVFGPIGKLGWGTPTLITADIGVVLEVPTWKIILLGRMHAALPDEKVGLIELNLDVMGLLDIPGKTVAIDATLYDSRVVQWTISGDMALRSRWGDAARFVLSVGGWNPRLDPPSGFPELDRVRAAMGPPGGNPKLEYTGYFAITSNTVQAGAGVHLLAKAGPASVEGRLAFDALIQFDPFGFVIDFLASLAVQVKGKGLTIKIEGTLSGPGPFRVAGKISIEIALWEISAKLDVTIGQADDREGLPSARIMPELTEALSRPKNWQAQLPEAHEALVSFREIESSPDEVLAHPMGKIGVRQTVVPLEFRIEKYGEATPSGYTRFEIEAVSVGGEAAIELGATKTEQFAPAKYTKMSDSEKMDSPAFEEHVAGQRMRHGGIYTGYDEDSDRDKNRREATLNYESSVIDRPKNNHGTSLSNLGRFRTENLNALSGITVGVLDALSEVSAVANSPVRTSGVERFRLSPDEQQSYQYLAAGLPITTTSGEEDLESPQDYGGQTPDVGGLAGPVSVSEPRYVIAEAATLQTVDIPTAEDGPMSKTAAERALARYRERHPIEARELRVVREQTARDAETVVADGGGWDRDLGRSETFGAEYGSHGGGPL